MFSSTFFLPVLNTISWGHSGTCNLSSKHIWKHGTVFFSNSWYATSLAHPVKDFCITLNVIGFVPGDFTDLRSCLLTTSYYFFSWLKHMSSYLTLQKHILFFFPPRKKNRPLFVFLLFLLTFVPYIWRSLIICS